MKTKNEIAFAALTAKYIGASNCRGSRIKVTSQRGSKTYPYPHELAEARSLLMPQVFILNQSKRTISSNTEKMPKAGANSPISLMACCQVASMYSFAVNKSKRREPSTGLSRADETKQNENMTTTQDKTRHTSGPWHVVTGEDWDGATVQNPNGRIVACCDGCDIPGATKEPTTEEAKANARLIAAAPELLEALRNLTHPMASDEDLQHALAVIAKAERRAEP